MAGKGLRYPSHPRSPDGHQLIDWMKMDVSPSHSAIVSGEHMLYRRTRSANARHALDGRQRTLVMATASAWKLAFEIMNIASFLSSAAYGLILNDEASIGEERESGRP